jgi:hypothetical protein
MKESKLAQFRPSPEITFALACARSFLVGPANFEAEQVLQIRSIDWQLVIEFAARHSILPALWNGIQELLVEQPPADVRRNLHMWALSNSHRTQSYARQLVGIISGLKDHGIQALAFKGPTLAMQLHEREDAREFVDLDLLVRRSDLARAAAVLVREGYELPKAMEPHDLDRITDGAVALRPPGSEMACVDLHWRVIPPYLPWSPSTEDLMNRAQTISLNGYQVSTLGTADLVFTECVHGAKHWWCSIQYVCDLAKIFEQSREVDWQQITEEARKSGIKRILLVGAALVSDLLEGWIPPGLRLEIETNVQVRAIENRILGNVLTSPGSSLVAFLREWEIPLRSLTTAGARLKYLSGRAFGPKERDWETMHMPRFLSPLYRLVHPGLGLARKVGLLYPRQRANDIFFDGFNQ